MTTGGGFFNNTAPGRIGRDGGGREGRASGGRQGRSGRRGLNDDLSLQITSAATKHIDVRAVRAGVSALESVGTNSAQNDRIKAIIQEQKDTKLLPEEGPSWMSNVMKVIDLPSKHVARPLMGTILAGLYAAVPGEQGGEKALRDAFTLMPIGPGSEARREKLRQALEETSLTPGVYTAMEMALDPTSWIGVGTVFNPVKGLAKAGLKGTLKQSLGGALARQTTVPFHGGPVQSLLQMDEVIDMMANDGVMARVGDRLSRVPVVKQVLGVINPSAAYQRGGTTAKEIQRFGNGHMLLLEQGEALSNQAVAAAVLRQKRGIPFKLRGGKTILDDGVTEMDIMDVLEKSPGLIKAGKLNQAQREFVDDYLGVINNGMAMLKAEGIAPAEVFMREGLTFVPRIVVGKDGIETIGEQMGRAVGAKASSFKQRYYDTMEEGVQNGIDYLNDPLAVLQQHMRGIYRAAADVRYANAIKPFGHALSTGDDVLKYHRNILARSHQPLVAAGVTIQKAISANVKLTNKSFTREIYRLQRSEPEFAARLRAAMNGKKSLEEQKQLLTALKSEMAQKVARSKASLSDAEKAYKKTVGKTNVVDKKLRAHPLFNDISFTQEHAALITARFAPAGGAWLKNISEINDTMRFTATAFDMGGGFIQAMPLLLADPAAWVRGQARAVKSFADPDFHLRWKATRENTFKEMAQYNVPISAEELTVAGSAGGVVARGAERLGRPGAPVRSVIKRASTSFNMIGDSARAETWEALKPIALRRYGVKTTLNKKTGAIVIDPAADPSAVHKALSELGNFVSKSTGALPNSKLGIGATQSQVERSLLFASRYFRATVGLTADAFQGGLRGELARRSIGKMLASGYLMHYATATALGQAPNLDPRKGNFLAVEVNGQMVGPGSAWLGLARFAASVFEQIAPPEWGGDIDDGQDKLLSFDPQKSILVQVARYKASPIVGFGWDMISGRDPIGGPVHNPLEEPLKFFHPLKGDIAQRMVPIWAQQFLPDIDEGEFSPTEGNKGIGAVAEFIGLRSFPTSVFAQRSALRNALSQSNFAREWKDLSSMEQNRITFQSEDLVRMNQQVRAWGLERSDELGQRTSEYLEKKGSFRKEYVESIALAEAAVRAGDAGDDLGITAAAFRERVKIEGIALRTSYRDLDDPEGNYGIAIEHLKEMREQGDSGPEILEDNAFDEYFVRVILGTDEETINPETGEKELRTMEDVYGSFDFAERTRREDEILNKYGEEVFEKMMAKIRMGSDPLGKNNVVSPLLADLDEGRLIFEPYWGIGDDLAEKAGVSAEWEHYKKLEGNVAADELLESNPMLKRINDNVTSARQLMRDRSPALDAYLVKWGYTPEPRNRKVKAFGKKTVQNLDFEWNALEL